MEDVSIYIGMVLWLTFFAIAFYKLWQHRMKEERKLKEHLRQIEEQFEAEQRQRKEKYHKRKRHDARYYKKEIRRDGITWVSRFIQGVREGSYGPEVTGNPNDLFRLADLNINMLCLDGKIPLYNERPEVLALADTYLFLGVLKKHNVAALTIGDALIGLYENSDEPKKPDPQEVKRLQMLWWEHWKRNCYDEVNAYDPRRIKVIKKELGIKEE